MQNMPMCPMMMGQMPGMPMMQEPMQMTMPMHMQMPEMGDMHEHMMMPMGENEDDRDEEYFTGMYGETSHKMMPFIKRAVDRMEEEHDIYEGRPERDMVDRMTEKAYYDMRDHMPEMFGDMHEERQLFGHGEFARDLVGVLLINELLRRRRHRRRFYPGYPIYGPGFFYGPGFGYNDYDYYY